MDSQINCIKTHHLARFPTRDMEVSVGFSLFAVEDVIYTHGLGFDLIANMTTHRCKQDKIGNTFESKQDDVGY